MTNWRQTSEKENQILSWSGDIVRIHVILCIFLSSDKCQLDLQFKHDVYTVLYVLIFFHTCSECITFTLTFLSCISMWQSC